MLPKHQLGTVAAESGCAGPPLSSRQGGVSGVKTSSPAFVLKAPRYPAKPTWESPAEAASHFFFRPNLGHTNVLEYICKMFLLLQH